MLQSQIKKVDQKIQVPGKSVAENSIKSEENKKLIDKLMKRLEQKPPKEVTEESRQLEKTSQQLMDEENRKAKIIVCNIVEREDKGR